MAWKLDITGRACDGAIIGTQGSGRSSIRLRTPAPQPAIAERVAGAGIVNLRFREGRVDMPVAGTLTRGGSRRRTVITPGASGRCGEGSPAPGDCGTRRYPADARLSVEYLPPSHWRLTDPAPLVPAIVISGPNSREWTTGAGFQGCPGVGIDDRLGVVGSPSGETGWGALPASKLFGRRKRFKVAGRTRSTIETARPGPAIISGTWPVATTIEWTLSFTRLARRPKGL